MIKSVIVITTYNRPDALDEVLDSLARMKTLPTEIVVADDGSGQDTLSIVNRWKVVFPIIHAWQPDDGFRAAEVRNLAVRSSKSDYIIFIDGDCIVPDDFLDMHLMLAEPGFMVVGNRILLSRELTDSILCGMDDILSWSWTSWVMARLRQRINRLMPIVKLPGRFWRIWRPLRWKGVHTCNLGLWRSDFVLVNGFDQSFKGWGHEDADLAIRLMRSGIYRKDGSFALPVYHLWHKDNSRDYEHINKERLLSEFTGRADVRCIHGLNAD
jgi:glycosyltransferase involved in cell wall biosynthesis